MEAYLPPHNFEKVIHARVTSSLDSCKFLYIGLDHQLLYYKP